jgi:hypothetical protein
MAGVRSGRFKYHKIELFDQQITMRGSAGLVHYQVTMEVTSNSVQKTLRNRAIAVWTNDGTSWRLVAFQATPHS